VYRGGAAQRGVMYRNKAAVLVIFFGALAAAAAPIVHGEPTLNQRKEKIKSMETKISPEALQRKKRSEAILGSEAVPINQHLPVIETEKEAKRRTKQEIAYRALALLTVAMKGEGLEQPIVEKIIKDYGLYPYLSPKEQAFINSSAPSQHDRIQFTWRYEAAWTLLWALGYVEKLETPSAICDVPRAVGFMRDRSAKQFIDDAKLRPLGEILDQADRIYRYHWAVVDARINGRKPPTGLEPGVTLERHYTLNWLIGYMDQEWDEISTDT
jgi:hypothetical protein